MKKTIIAFAIILLLTSIPLVSAVEQNEVVIKKLESKYGTDKTGIYKIIQTLKNKMSNTPSTERPILSILYLIGFVILLTGLTLWLLVRFVIHCLIINPIRVLIEYIQYRNQDNGTLP